MNNDNKQAQIKSVKRAARHIIGEPSRNRKRGAFKKKSKPIPHQKEWE